MIAAALGALLAFTNWPGGSFPCSRFDDERSEYSLRQVVGDHQIAQIIMMELAVDKYIVVFDMNKPNSWPMRLAHGII